MSSSSAFRTHCLNVKTAEQLQEILESLSEVKIMSFDASGPEQRRLCSGAKTDCRWLTAEFALKLETAEQWREWLREFQTLTKSQWIKHHSTPASKTTLLRVAYECHNSRRNKVPQYKKSGRSTKNALCEAKLSVVIKNASVHSSDGRLALGYRCLVELTWVHNHPLLSLEMLGFLRDSRLKQHFFDEYYEFGLTAAEALKAHKEEIQRSPEFNYTWFSDKSKCPDRYMAYHWYTIWRKNKLEEQEQEFVEFELEDDEEPESQTEVWEDLREHAKEQFNEMLDSIGPPHGEDDIMSLRTFLYQLGSCPTRQSKIQFLHRCGNSTREHEYSREQPVKRRKTEEQQQF